MIDYDYDYKDKTKKKKRQAKDDEKSLHKSKPTRNFKIIDDDIDINTLKPSEESEALVDLLDPEGPSIVEIHEYEDKPKVVQKVDVLSNNKWIKLDLCEDINGDLIVSGLDDDGNKINSTQNLFRKRGEKSNKQSNDTENSDDDLDAIPRKRIDNDGDLSPERRNRSAKGKHKEEREEEQDLDVPRVRVKKMTREDELKKIKNEEKLAKYMEWGKGLVQKKEREDKLRSDIYEADKPLARYKNDKDLDALLKEQEREDDPMLEYIKNNKYGDNKDKKKLKYRGPPAPPNRYHIEPGPRWDGVDRSNGFEKKYYESITAKKSREEEAYKWSIEDM